MVILFTLALRNLRRNLRRTVITTAAISLGVALMIWANNIGAGAYNQMIHTGVSTMAGHVVVQAMGYQKERDAGMVVTDAVRVEAQLESLFPGERVVSRVFLQGLLKSPEAAVGIMATAIDPQAEASVSDWHEKVVEGAFLSSAPDEIVIGKTLADSLGVTIDDFVTFEVQGKKGIEAQLFVVTGLLGTGSAELDGFFALMHLAPARTLLSEPRGATQVTLHLNNVSGMHSARDHVRAKVGTGLEVLTWPEALPEMFDLIAMDRAGNRFIQGVVAIIVLIGVLNTVLMSVLERMREFGVILALGVSPMRLATMVVFEGLVLGTLSALVGLGLGSLLTFPFAYWGVDYSALMGGETYEAAGVAIETVLIAAWDLPMTFIYVVGAVIATVLASLYPAFKASRLEPVAAMRSV